MNKTVRELLGDVPVEGLTGRQSKRTTFALSGKAEEILELLSDKQDVSTKDVIDDSVDYVWGKAADKQLGERLFAAVLENVSENITRKTRVVTQSSLAKTEELAETFGVSRDDVLEIACHVAATVRLEQIRNKRVALTSACEHLEAAQEKDWAAGALLDSVGHEIEDGSYHTAALGNMTQETIDSLRFTIDELTQEEAAWKTLIESDDTGKAEETGK